MINNGKHFKRTEFPTVGTESSLGKTLRHVRD